MAIRLAADGPGKFVRAVPQSVNGREEELQVVALGSLTNPSLVVEPRNNALQVIQPLQTSWFYPLDTTPANPVLVRNVSTEFTRMHFTNISNSPLFLKLYRANSAASITVGSTQYAFARALASGETHSIDPCYISAGLVIAWTTGSLARTDSLLGATDAITMWVSYL